MSQRLKPSLSVLWICIILHPAIDAYPQNQIQASFFELSSEPQRPRNAVLPPLVCTVLPGFDQWWEAQYTAGLVYSGAATSGLILATVTDPQNQWWESTRSIETRNDRSRFQALGLQFYSWAGGLSAYHSFRTALNTRRGLGEYPFISHEETPFEILKAPFQFTFLTRATSLLPLLGGAALIGVLSATDSLRRTGFGTTDAFFTVSFSYNAGTWEEAFFRGFMLPVARQYTHTNLLANAITAGIFSLAHRSKSNPIPWPQFLFGFYAGWLTQYRDWTISESIFIHTWWDILFIGALYAFEENKTSLPLLRFPTIQVYF